MPYLTTSLKITTSLLKGYTTNSKQINCLQTNNNYNHNKYNNINIVQNIIKLSKENKLKKFCEEVQIKNNTKKKGIFLTKEK